MSRSRWTLVAGAAVCLLLVAIPLAFVLVCGWPRSGSADFIGSGLARAVAQMALFGYPGVIIAAMPYAETIQALQPAPIAPPVPAVGLDPLLIRWLLVGGAIFLGLALGAWLLALLFRQEIGGRPAARLRPRLWLLIALGAATLAVYGISFVLPFSLPGYYHLPGISIGAIAGRDGATALATTAATVALFLLYGLAHRLCRGRNERWLWAVVLLGALLFAAANLYISTITTLDPYDYIARGRITGVHQGNPYVRAPSFYPNDPFMGYVSWSTATSAYGPLWEALSGISARLAGGTLWSNVLAYKVLALACYLISVPLVASILRRVAPQRALAGTLLFAWNPLVLMEGIANAHNDMLMVVLLLGAFWFLSRLRRPVEEATTGQHVTDMLVGGAAILLLTASILVKFVPGLFLPFFLLYMASGEKKWWRWLSHGLLLIPAALLAAWYYLPFWHPAVLDTFTRRADMFRMTVASVAKEALQKSIPAERAQAVITQPLLALFGIAYVILLALAIWTTLEQRSAPGQRSPGPVSRALFGYWEDDSPWGTLLQACLGAFLLYLLLGNFWYWPWYLILPIALLALGGQERFFAPLGLAACAGELAHLGWNFLWYWWGISWDTSYEIDALVVLGMVVPALVVYAVLTIWRRPGLDRQA